MVAQLVELWASKHMVWGSIPNENRFIPWVSFQLSRDTVARSRLDRKWSLFYYFVPLNLVNDPGK